MRQVGCVHVMCVYRCGWEGMCMCECVCVGLLSLCFSCGGFLSALFFTILITLHVTPNMYMISIVVISIYQVRQSSYILSVYAC